MANANVASDAGTLGHKPLVARGRRGVHEPGAGLAVCLECVRGPVRERVQMETRRDLDGIHHRGGGLRADLHSSRPAAG